MSDELEVVAPDDSEEYQEGISPLYYFYRDLLGVTAGAGRTAGRKIGVVQEVVVRKLLERSPTINERMLFERFLPGFSGAGHKVEFMFYGMLARLSASETFVNDGLYIQYVEATDAGAKLLWRVGRTDKWRRAVLKPRATVSTALGTALAQRGIGVLLPNGEAVISILDLNDVLASVESKRVGAQIFVGSTKLGSGIQTIEKAKQTSLVAIDADLKFNKVVRPILLRDKVDPERRRYISVVALGNGVHWTTNDHNVLKTFVDHTYLVHDDVMMGYGEYVRKLAVRANEDIPKFFMNYFDGMTKAKPDGFTVKERDLAVIEPADDKRSLTKVLEQHIEKHNHVP